MQITPTQLVDIAETCTGLDDAVPLGIRNSIYIPNPIEVFINEDDKAGELVDEGAGWVFVPKGS